MAHSFVDSISDVDVISDAEVSKLTFLIPLHSLLISCIQMYQYQNTVGEIACISGELGSWDDCKIFQHAILNTVKTCI